MTVLMLAALQAKRAAAEVIKTSSIGSMGWSQLTCQVLVWHSILVGGLEHEFYVSIYIYIYRECHHPNWRTHIFQYGWNHQPVWLQGDWWLDSIWQWILKHDTYVTLCYIYNIWANDGTPNVHHWVDGIRLEDSRSITCCPDVSMDFLDTLRCIHTIYREFMGMCIYI